MHHLDLFSGIGGFSLAADQVFQDVRHTFVEINPFCQAVLKKHWPESTIYADIKTFTNTASERLGEERISIKRSEKRFARIDLLTGGFPCQPFSHAGRRKGTADDRYLWPEMFRVIREFKPTWIIAENVRGLVTWNEGMVLEQICIDLESEDYEVQPFIIPACGVNAPHRRERVWIIANKFCKGLEGGSQKATGYCGQHSREWSNKRWTDWDKNWLEVATRLCRVDDGVSSRVDRLKALGNAIVPQVAVEIMRAILLTSQQGSGKAG